MAAALCLGPPRAARADDTPGYRLALDLDLGARYVWGTSDFRTFSAQDPGAATTSFGFDDSALRGAARVTGFLTPVEQSEAPPPLQAYLQRRSSLWFEARGGLQRTSSSTHEVDTRRGGGAGAGLELFFGQGGDSLVVQLGFGIDRVGVDVVTTLPDTSQTLRLTALDGTLGLSIRRGTLTAGAHYRYRGAPYGWDAPSPNADGYFSPGFGAFSLRLRNVLRQSIDLGAELEVHDAIGGVGGGIDGRMGYHVRRNTAVLAGLGLEVSPPAAPTRTFIVTEDPAPGAPGRHALALRWSIGVSHWWSERWGVTARYLGRLDHKDLGFGNVDAVGSELRLGLAVRL